VRPTSFRDFDQRAIAGRRVEHLAHHPAQQR
jgi:hypothetical protein